MRLGAWIVMIVTLIMFLSLIGLTIPGLNPVLQGVGVNINETNSTIISADIESSTIWNKLFGSTAFTLFGVNFTAGILITLLGTGAVIVGLFAKGYDTSLVILPFIIFIGGLFISTFWAIMNYVIGFNQGWITSIVVIIFVGLAVGFIMSLVDYFAGR
jgi:hypothetical protein